MSFTAARCGGRARRLEGDALEAFCFQGRAICSGMCRAEHRSLWMGHAVRDGSRTTANSESDDPEMLTDVALATDCVMALIQQHCAKPLFAVDVLLTKKDLQAIGARVIPEILRKQRVGGGHDRDRTCDPYHVKVVLSR